MARLSFVPRAHAVVRRFAGATRGVAAVEFALILPLMLLLYLGSAETTQAVMASRKASMAARTLSDLVSQQDANVVMTDVTMGSIFNAASAIMQPFPSGVVSGAYALSVNVAAVSFTAFTSDPTSASPSVPKALVWVPSQNKLATAFTPTGADPGYAAKVRWSVSPSTIYTGSGNTTLNNPAGKARTCGAGQSALTPVGTTTKPTATNLQQGLYAPGSIVLADISYAYTPNFGATIVQWVNAYSWSTSTGMTAVDTTYMQPRNSNWTACAEGNGSDSWICYPTRETGTCATY